MDLYEALQRGARGRASSKHGTKMVGRAAQRARHFGDFDCGHCRLLVSAEPALSGVQHRNHCPHCLWSRHVDLAAAGDRLCACKGLMRPVGLARKHRRKKYMADEAAGELLLVHQCAACGAFSLNRLAADDNPARLWEVFAASLAQPPAVGAEIALLGEAERERLSVVLG